MKRHFVFLAVLLSVFGAFALIFIALRNPSRIEAGLRADQFLETFQAEHHSLLEINLAHLYGGSGQFEVLNSRLGVQAMSLTLLARTA